MTDRQVGGEGLNVDLNVQTQRRVAGEGLHVDLVPASLEGRTGSVGLTIDYFWPQGVQVGVLGSTVELVPTTTKRLGSIGLMVDYVIGGGTPVPTTAVRWSGVHFETGTSSPLIYWDGSAFQSSGTQMIVWNVDHFDLVP